jgi:hypothetical protein
MKVFKKFMAVLCSATLIASASVTAFAEGPTSETGTGNMIAYNFDTVTVPTTIKIAFNPQGLPITTGDGVTTPDKIVSLGYGIANKASTDKKIVVKFAANAVVADGETTDVEFVDAEAKAQAKSDSNATGAEAGEHKIFLYVVPATAEPAINDGSDTAFAVTAGEDNATAANLADVKMTAAAAAKGIVFAEGTNNDAFANIGFALDKSTYALKDGESIDFDTPQSEVADKLELSAFGTTSITGFTFKGEMNTNTVWTDANITAISITPTYEVVEKGTEGAVADTHGMVTLTEAEDIAEPEAPTPSEAQQAALAAAGFKTTHATVLALDADSVTGSEEEIAAIEAAITAFEALSEAAKEILAAEDPAITAESLAALKTASEAAGGPTAISMTPNASGVYIAHIEAAAANATLEHITVDGVSKDGQIGTSITWIASAKNLKITAERAQTLDLASGKTIVATIGGEEFTIITSAN